jgi:hypothetical protein
MRPSALPMLSSARAYALAGVPTAPLIQSMVSDMAQELANTMGGPVSVSLPGNYRITREPTTRAGVTRYA